MKNIWTAILISFVFGYVAANAESNPTYSADINWKVEMARLAHHVKELQEKVVLLEAGKVDASYFTKFANGELAVSAIRTNSIYMPGGDIVSSDHHIQIRSNGGVVHVGAAPAIINAGRTLDLQTDGNLVLYKNNSNPFIPLWDSATNGR